MSGDYDDGDFPFFTPLHEIDSDQWIQLALMVGIYLAILCKIGVFS